MLHIDDAAHAAHGGDHIDRLLVQQCQNTIMPFTIVYIIVKTILKLMFLGSPTLQHC